MQTISVILTVLAWVKRSAFILSFNPSEEMQLTGSLPSFLCYRASYHLSNEEKGRSQLGPSQK